MDELRVIERFKVPSDPGDAVRERGRAMLRAEMAAVSRSRRQPKLLRRTLLAAAVTAVALIATVVVPSLVGEESTAAATLRGMSRVALGQPYEPIRSGQYVYTKTEAVWLACSGSSGAVECVPNHVIREAWIAPDGSGQLKQEGLHETFGPGGLWFEDLASLPTDVPALREIIEERSGDGDDPPASTAASSSPGASAGPHQGMFTVIGDLLRETHASPELRAALYEIVSTLDGVQLIGDTTDELGREGIGVGYWDGENLEVLIFDPSTSVILGERTETADGEVIGWSSVIASGIVDSVRERVG